MKVFKFFAVCALVVAMTASCYSVPSVEKQPEGITKADVDSASYALGVYYGQMIVMNNLGDMNMNQVWKGLRDAIKGDKEELDNMFVNTHMSNFMRKREEVMAELNKKTGEEFLAKNAKAEGVDTTEKGLQYMVVRKGNGVFPTSKQDTVKVSYEGCTLDGKVFDSSYDRGDTATFVLKHVIEGWQEGLMFCDEGSEVVLWIPSDMAYGPRGPMGPNQTLKFKVELHEVMPFVEKEEEAK
ncbi:MAG: FKBP-type peptidyl-prolyl cis-trans isomerase [Bacteroidales bacterium]|nr:FKBP-type peptidyl-prolyl cis-trans isomerase [Bacteroidales bacterium]